MALGTGRPACAELVLPASETSTSKRCWPEEQVPCVEGVHLINDTSQIFFSPTHSPILNFSSMWVIFLPPHHDFQRTSPVILNTYNHDCSKSILNVSRLPLSLTSHFSCCQDRQLSTTVPAHATLPLRSSAPQPLCPINNAFVKNLTILGYCCLY